MCCDSRLPSVNGIGVSIMRYRSVFSFILDVFRLETSLREWDRHFNCTDLVAFLSCDSCKSSLFLLLALIFFIFLARPLKVELCLVFRNCMLNMFLQSETSFSMINHPCVSFLCCEKNFVSRSAFFGSISWCHGICLPVPVKIPWCKPIAAC